MKRLLVLVAGRLLASQTVTAQAYAPYYSQRHLRTRPPAHHAQPDDARQLLHQFPNTNPYTGEKGTRRTREATASGYSTPTRSTQAPAYETQTLSTGARGGTYYLNDAGSKVYVK